MDGEEDEFGFLDDADAHESVGASSSSSSFAGRGRDDNAGQQRRPYSATVTVTAHGRNGENPRGLSLTEKVAAVLEYLKGKERNEMISMAEIAEDTGIPLEADAELLEELEHNEKITMANRKMRYRPLLENVHNKQDLLDHLRYRTEGISIEYVNDAYPNAKYDVEDLVRRAEVIRVRNHTSNSSSVIFPRLEPLVVPLSGTFSVDSGSNIVHSTSNMTGELYRGDAVILGGKTYRVSMSMRVSSNREEQAKHEPAVRETGGQDTAANTQETKRRGGKPIQYKEEFTPDTVPLDRNYEGESADDIQGKKYGAHADIRNLWHKCLDRLPESHSELRRCLKSAGLEQISKMEPDTIEPHRTFREAKPKPRKRPRKASHGRSKTNKHLEGTEAGRALELARKERYYQQFKEQLASQGHE